MAQGGGYFALGTSNPAQAEVKGAERKAYFVERVCKYVQMSI